MPPLLNSKKVKDKAVLYTLSYYIKNHQLTINKTFLSK